MIGAMRKPTCLLIVVLAAGCGQRDTDPGPGGVTVAEAKALDQAAEMLEQRRLPPEATRDEARPAASPAPKSTPSPTPTPSE